MIGDEILLRRAEQLADELHGHCSVCTDLAHELFVSIEATRDGTIDLTQDDRAAIEAWCPYDPA